MRPAPAAPSPRVAWVLAVSLPVFAVSARAVTDEWPHPWSHLWIPATIAVVLEVRQLLHRYPPRTSHVSHWHLYFLAAGVTTALLASSSELSGSLTGLLDDIGGVAVLAVGLSVAGRELSHLRGPARS